MPLYHYKCPKCNYEEMQYEKMENRNNHKCPKCDTLMDRVFTRMPPVKYNSPGFYSTQYERLEEPEGK